MSPQRRDQAASEHVAGHGRSQEAEQLPRSGATGSLAALDELRQGVVVVDADGIEVFRNAAAERYREARHADAVVAGATRRARRTGVAR